MPIEDYVKWWSAVATREGGVDRNIKIGFPIVYGHLVATREGGVDRNFPDRGWYLPPLFVATREGGVDRNSLL